MYDTYNNFEDCLGPEPIQRQPDNRLSDFLIPIGVLMIVFGFVYGLFTVAYPPQPAPANAEVTY